jgi:hypothetical protein
MNTAKEEKERQEEDRHEARMLLLIQQSMTAAANTPEKTDDVLVPIIIMSIEDKRIMAHALTANSRQAIQFQKIKAPETFGEAVQKSTGAILGIGAIVNSAIQSNNLADVATAGITSAGTTNTISGDGNSITNDSYKSGSQNTITGDGNETTGGSITSTNTQDNSNNECSDGNCDETDGTDGEAGIEGGGGGFDLDECLSSPPGGVINGIPLYYYGCSCHSHSTDRC